MKREIIKEFDMLGDALNTLNAQFSYRLMNLCVKAEPVSLLSVEAMIEGESQKLEKCAQIGKEDDYTFQIYPNYDGDIPALAKAIFMDHPEFKQEMRTMQVDISEDESKPDMQDVHYIQVTMPEVDDNRYDVLKNGVNAFYEENKAQMDGESDEDVKKVREARDKQTKSSYEQRDKIYNDKLQEIEDAHEKWQHQQKSNKINRLKDIKQ